MANKDDTLVHTTESLIINGDFEVDQTRKYIYGYTNYIVVLKLKRDRIPSAQYTMHTPCIL